MGGAGARDGSGGLGEAFRPLRSRAEGLVRFARLGGSFRSYILPHRRKLLFAVSLSLLYAGLRLLEPWPLQILFDRAILDRPTTFLGVDPLTLVGGSRQLLLLASAASVLLIAGLSGSVYYLQSVLIAGVGQDIVRELRQDVFHQLQRLGLPFHRRSDTGDLLMRLTGDMIMLREMILASLVTLTTHLLFLMAVLVLMLTVSLRLTVISLGLAPALYILFRWFRRRMVLAARKQRKREGRLAAAIEEVLLAIPMIQAYTAEEQEDERFRHITKRSARAGLRAARLEAGMQRVVEVVIAMGTALVLFFGVSEILRGSMTPGIFLVFLAYLRAMNKPVRGLSKVTERTARASAAAERVLEVLHAKREVKDSRGAVEAPRLRGRIRFSHVTFDYDAGTRALEDVAFEIEPGENVALVGPSGSGKTTLLSLILRFHKPTDGKVRIDGENIKSYTLKSLRSQISFLPQEPFILGTTIRDNLFYGRPGASDEQLWEALRAVDLEEFVRSLPKGLDSMVRSRGQTLSGGQRQKLAMARAMLKDAPILLLDEPTTGMDARTERDVLMNLDRLRRGRTTVTIAHRFATVQGADRVLVLDRGRLVEDGRPSELLARDSLFRLLADVQGFVPAEGGGTGSADRRPGPSGGSTVRLEGELLPDPSVHGVGKVLEPGGVDALLDEMKVFVDPGPSPRVRAVKQRVGQRALLRIDGAERSWYVKLLRGSKALKQGRTLLRVAREAAELGLAVPSPSAHLVRFGGLVCEELPGKPLLGAGWAHEASEPGLLRRLGHILADVHRSMTRPVRNGGPEVERERLEKVKPIVQQHRPDLLERYSTALGAWWESRAAGGAGADRASSLHGDFYPAQVLVHTESDGTPSFAVLDWDETCAGDPERDVANFEAHIVLEELRGQLTAETCRALVDAFERGYLEAGSLDPALLDWYRRGTLLRLSGLYASRDFGRTPPNPPELAAGLLARAES